MKVVLFCGGLGMRLREYSESIPKPMVPLGDRPIMWHLMKWYAHYGHKEFILCLGYRGDVIKKYFLQYDEWLTNDFVLDGNNGQKPQMLSTDIHDWKITFVNTGLNSNIGERLKAVQPYIGEDEMFLANYSDGLSDVPLTALVQQFRRKRKTACLVAVNPAQSFHTLQVARDGSVRGISDMSREGGITINGGFFIFRREIFESLRPGEDLVHEPLQRLITRNQVMAYQHGGFWACMDTYKDKQKLEDLVARGDAPWEVWRPRGDRPEAVPEKSRGRRSAPPLPERWSAPDGTAPIARRIDPQHQAVGRFRRAVRVRRRDP